MVVGIGCDITEHNVTKLLGWDTDTSLLQRVFSRKEIELYKSDNEIKFIIGRFAAKEAILKCLGTGMYDGISLPDIQILQSVDGKPTVELCGLVKEISDSMEISLWHVTITHSSNYSLAFVIAEKQ